MFNLPLIVVSDLFSLYIFDRKSFTEITMQFYTSIIQTSELPSTGTVLNRILPDIYFHNCFNDSHLPFKKEVLDTEIGHLFEHVFLEYLSQLSYMYEGNGRNFRGETRWNWKEDPFGMFRITIKSKYLTKEIFFNEALNKSVYLLETIYYLNLPVSLTV